MCVGHASYAKESGARIGVNPVINFGESVSRLTQRTMRVTVHSLSGISSDVGVVVQRYYTPDARTLDDVSGQLEMQAVCDCVTVCVCVFVCVCVCVCMCVCLICPATFKCARIHCMAHAPSTITCSADPRSFRFS